MQKLKLFNPYQLQLPYNLIRFEGAIMAPSPFWGRKYLLSDAALRLIDEFCELQTMKGVQRNHRERYEVTLSNLIANLLRADFLGMQLMLPRDTAHMAHWSNPNKITNKMLSKFAEFLADKHLIDYVFGESCKSTSFVFLTNYGQHFFKDDAQTFYNPLAPLIEISEGEGADKRKINLPKHVKHKAKIAQMEKQVQSFLDVWKNSKLTLNKKSIPIRLKRVFNKRQGYEHFTLGGRFYGGDWLGLSSSARQDLKINGQQVVEIDFKALHPSILYAWKGLEAPADCYLIDGLDRPTAKALMLRLMNSDNLTAFKANVTKSASAKAKKINADYLLKREHYELQRKKGLKAREPERPIVLEGFIDGIPEGLTGEVALNAIMLAHSPIADLFGTEHIGLKLQYADSELMANILGRLSLPVLPVHDSIVCRQKDVFIVREAMQAEFKAMFGVSPRIEIKQRKEPALEPIIQEHKPAQKVFFFPV